MLYRRDNISFINDSNANRVSSCNASFPSNPPSDPTSCLVLVTLSTCLPNHLPLPLSPTLSGSLDSRCFAFHVLARYDALRLATFDGWHRCLAIRLACQIYLPSHFSSSCSFSGPQMGSTDQLIRRLLRLAPSSLILQTVPCSA